jgi:hypothetical protein
MVNEIILIVAFILALTIVGVKILPKRKSLRTNTPSDYSEEQFEIINIEEKAKNISDWVHSNCKDLSYNFIYNSIRQQLEED